MIYFVMPIDGGPVKIGCAENVERRVRQLECIYGLPLVLLGTMRGSFQKERQIHERFAALRIGKSEQFQPAPELMDFIGAPLFASVQPAERMGHCNPMEVIAVTCRASWKAWVQAFAKKRRITPAQLIDQALVLFAEMRGYERPPDRL